MGCYMGCTPARSILFPAAPRGPRCGGADAAVLLPSAAICPAGAARMGGVCMCVGGGNDTAVGPLLAVPPQNRGPGLPGVRQQWGFGEGVGRKRCTG